MLLFGHIGITLAGVILFKDLLPKNRPHAQPETSGLIKDDQIHTLKGLSAGCWALLKMTKGLDLRAVIIGSLLPDIIDKPIGHIFFQDVFGNGVLYTHTLLFTIVLALCGCFIYIIYKKSFTLLLAFGCFIHLILDTIFLYPRVFLWPLFGLTFPKGDFLPFTEWILKMIRGFIHVPWVSIPEFIGVVITLWFFWLLWKQKKLQLFITKGVI